MQELKISQGMQVISRSAAILRVLNDSCKSLGTIANLTGLPRSTVQRIVDALAVENLVEAGAQGVRLGWGLQHIAEKGRTDIVILMRPVLEELFTRTRETVDISVAQNGEVSFMDRIISDQELRVVPFPDKPRPLYAMANGKALLSALSDTQIEKQYEKGMETLTSFTLTSASELLSEIAAIRKSGFSYDREEHAIGVCAIGTPVIVQGYKPFAFSVVTPISRYESHMETIKDALLFCREMAFRIIKQPD